MSYDVAPLKQRQNSAAYCFQPKKGKWLETAIEAVLVNPSSKACVSHKYNSIISFPYIKFI